MSAGNQHRSAWALIPLVVILLMMLLAPLLAAERGGATLTPDRAVGAAGKGG